MASPSACSRCLILARGRPSRLSSASIVRAFTTTAPLTLPKPPSQGGKGKPIEPRRSNGIVLKKKSAPARAGKPPLPGERKAQRKRVSLMNSNALPVPGMPDLTPETMADPQRVGSMLGLGLDLIEQLRAVEAFKPTQGWGWFRRPAALVRAESVRLGEFIARESGGGTSRRVVLSGERGSGKSVLLLQALAMGFAQGWTVISIPEGEYQKLRSPYNKQPANKAPAHALTIGQTEYALAPNTQPALYTQPAYTSALLEQIAQANTRFLTNTPLALPHSLPITLAPKLSLHQLTQLGVRDPALAPTIFAALWAEITAPARPPVLVALDGLAHLLGPTSYRSPAHEHIHALDFHLARHFAACLSGAVRLPNGGLVLAATCGSNVVNAESLAMALKQSAGEEGVGDGFKAVDARAVQCLRGVEVWQVGGLSKSEARGLMEYYASSGVLRERVDEAFVGEKWAVAGGGVVGEVERGALRMKIS
ncbi:MAG: 37S ribosomal protein S23 mitochondrial [Trizodia sp. TS-e1964]|nr:MAG: 37S ribosomal protein S23 mitochondrial [Trizodia sp. TS-e1964]